METEIKVVSARPAECEPEVKLKSFQIARKMQPLFVGLPRARKALR